MSGVIAQSGAPLLRPIIIALVSALFASGLSYIVWLRKANVRQEEEMQQEFQRMKNVLFGVDDVGTMEGVVEIMNANYEKTEENREKINDLMQEIDKTQERVEKVKEKIEKLREKVKEEQ